MKKNQVKALTTRTFPCIAPVVKELVNEDHVRWDHPDFTHEEAFYVLFWCLVLVESATFPPPSARARVLSLCKNESPERVDKHHVSADDW
jgi:hypothetical protein